MAEKKLPWTKADPQMVKRALLLLRDMAKTRHESKQPTPPRRREPS